MGTLCAQGDLAGARALEEKVLGVRRKVLGEDHPDTSISAWNLLQTLLAAQDYQRAMTILEENLLWLLGRDPSSLGTDQRNIRNGVCQFIESLKEQKSIDDEKGP